MRLSALYTSLLSHLSHQQGVAILKQAKKDFAMNRFDMSSGLLVGQASFREIPSDKGSADSSVVEEVQATEIDKELAAIASLNSRMVSR